MLLKTLYDFRANRLKRNAFIVCNCFLRINFNYLKKYGAKIEINNGSMKINSIKKSLLTDKTQVLSISFYNYLISILL